MQFGRFSKPCTAIELAKLCRWARLPQPSGCVWQGLGKALPNKIPMGQNERNAKSGTSVESCSLLLLTSLHFTTDIFSAKSRVCICKHFVNKLPSPAVRRCNSFCFYGIAAAAGLRHTNGDIGVTISNIRPECFSFSLPLLQFQKCFLATSANKAFEIYRPARCSSLLRSGVGDLARTVKKNTHPKNPFSFFRCALSQSTYSKSVFCAIPVWLCSLKIFNFRTILILTLPLR